MDNRWLVAFVLVAGGFVVGALAGWLVRRQLTRARHDGRDVSVVAGVAGLFVFWFIALIGVLFAVSLVRPDTLEDLPRQVLDYSPRLLVAGFILIAGYALAEAAAGLVGFGLERASGRVVGRIAQAVRWTIFIAAVILALAQLGVETTILILLTGIFGFGVAAAGALLVGFGGRRLAGEIAAGRYFSRFVFTDASIITGGDSGRVVALHPATIEIETIDGERRHIAYTRLLEAGLTIAGQPDD